MIEDSMRIELEPYGKISTVECPWALCVRGFHQAGSELLLEHLLKSSFLNSLGSDWRRAVKPLSSSSHAREVKSRGTARAWVTSYLARWGYLNGYKIRVDFEQLLVELLPMAGKGEARLYSYLNLGAKSLVLDSVVPMATRAIEADE